MGLDMYLEARVTTYRPFGEEAPSDIRGAMVGAADMVGLPSSSNLDYIRVTREAAYWRKDNQIHAWFVANVQDGKDDCGNYDVSVEQLKELRDLCANLLVNRNSAEAREKLPPQSGFFFGSTEIDEYYWHGLDDTVNQIDRVLAIPSAELLDFSYHSSW